MKREILKNIAQEIGFDLCGVVKAGAVVPQVISFVDNWIERGNNGSMEWMLRNSDKRYDPTLLYEGCNSVVVCALSYQTLESYSVSGISDYARGDDYHYIIKGMLTKLHQRLEEEEGIEFSSRAFCDSAPILERYWGVEAGFGWIGRNSMLINRNFGSWFFIGVLLTEQQFDSYDSRDSYYGCGNCHKCVDNCPSGALNGDSTLDCNRCTTYLTIEHKGDYSETQQEILKKNSNWFFGCDECLRICPWNIKSFRNLDTATSKERVELFGREKYIFPSKREEITKQLVKQLKQTPLSRIKIRK